MGFCFGGNKCETEEILDDRYVINGNAALLDELVGLSEADAAVRDRLDSLRVTVKYFNPTCSKKILSLDKRIADALGDVKMEVYAARERGKWNKVGELLGSLEELVISREAAEKAV